MIHVNDPLSYLVDSEDWVTPSVLENLGERIE